MDKKLIRIKIDNAKYTIHQKIADMFFQNKITWEDYVKLIEGANDAIFEVHKQLDTILEE